MLFGKASKNNWLGVALLATFLMLGQFAQAEGGKCASGVAKKEMEPLNDKLTPEEMGAWMARKEVEDLFEEVTAAELAKSSDSALEAYTRELYRLPVLRKENRKYLTWMRHLERGMKVTQDAVERRLLEGLRKEYEKRLVEGNQRFVFSLARKYGRRIDILDAVSAGNLGLLKAIAKFDPTKTVEYNGVVKPLQFSTYAIWWVRQFIQNEVRNTSSTIRRPVHTQKNFEHILMATEILFREREFDAEPSPSEIAAKLNELGKKPTGKKAYTAEIVRKTIEMMITSESVAEVQGGKEEKEDTYSLFDRTSGLENTDPARVVETETGLGLSESIILLPNKQREVIAMRFGLPRQVDGRDGMHEPMTLDEVGRFYDVTGERVRQIELKGLKRLRQLEDLRRKDPEELLYQVLAKREELGVNRPVQVDQLRLLERQRVHKMLQASHKSEIWNSSKASANKAEAAPKETVKPRALSFEKSEALMKKVLENRGTGLISALIHSQPVTERFTIEDKWNLVRYFIHGQDLATVAYTMNSKNPSETTVRQSLRRGVEHLKNEHNW